MTQNINLNIVGTANFTPVYAEIGKLKTAMAGLQNTQIGKGFNAQLNAQLKSYEQDFLKVIESTKGFNVEQVKLADATDHLTTKLSRGQFNLGQYYSMFRRSQSGVVQELEQIAQAQAKISKSMVIPSQKGGYAQVITDMSGVADKIKTTEIYQKALNTAMMDGSTKLINFGKNTQWAGRQLTVGLTVPLMAAGGALAAMFYQVDQNLRKMQAVYGVGGKAGGAFSSILPSQQEIASIRTQVVQLSQEMARTYGQTAQETAGVAADLAAAGYTGSQLLGLTKTVTKAMVLGESDRQTAMKATIALQSAYKLSTDETATALNFFSAAQAATSTTMRDLIDAIPRVGPVVRNLGGSYKDTVAMLVAMKEGGVAAGEGANALKNSLGRLISPTKTAVDSLKVFGVDILGIVNKNSGNVVGMIEALQQALSTLSPLARQQAITDIFGKFQMSRMTALLDNFNQSGTQSAKVMQMMGLSAKQLSDIAANQTKTLQDSTSGQFKIAIETLKADLMPIGETFLQVATVLIKAVDFIVKAFEKLGPIKYVLGAVLGGAAVLGPIIMFSGLMANLVGQVFKLVTLFKMFRGGFAEGGGWSSPIKSLTTAFAGLSNYFQEVDKAMVASEALSKDLNATMMKQEDSLNILTAALTRYTNAVERAATINNINGGGIVPPNGGPAPGPLGPGGIPFAPTGGPTSPLGIVGNATRPTLPVQNPMSVIKSSAGEDVGRTGFGYTTPSGEKIKGNEFIHLVPDQETQNVLGKLAVVPGYFDLPNSPGKAINRNLKDNPMPIIPPSMMQDEEIVKRVLRDLKLSTAAWSVEAHAPALSLENITNSESSKIAMLRAMQQMGPSVLPQLSELHRNNATGQDVHNFFSQAMGQEQWQAMRQQAIKDVLAAYETAQTSVHEQLISSGRGSQIGSTAELQAVTSKFGSQLLNEYKLIVDNMDQQMVSALSIESEKTGQSLSTAIREGMRRNAIPALLNLGATASTQSDLIVKEFENLIQVAQQAMAKIASQVGSTAVEISAMSGVGTVPVINQAAARVSRIEQIAKGGLGAVKLATGGKVQGPGGPRDDVIPAMLSDGEYVVNANAVGHYGTGFLDAVNTKKLASGGPARSSLSGIMDSLFGRQKMQSSAQIQDYLTSPNSVYAGNNIRDFFASRNGASNVDLAHIEDLIKSHKNLGTLEEQQLMKALEEHASGAWGNKSPLASLSPQTVDVGRAALDARLSQMPGDTVRLYRSIATTPETGKTAPGHYGYLPAGQQIEKPQPYMSYSSDIENAIKFAQNTQIANARIVEVDVPKSSIIGIQGANYTGKPGEGEFIVRSSDVPSESRYVTFAGLSTTRKNSSDPLLKFLAKPGPESKGILLSDIARRYTQLPSPEASSKVPGFREETQRQYAATRAGNFNFGPRYSPQHQLEFFGITLEEIQIAQRHLEEKYGMSVKELAKNKNRKIVGKNYEDQTLLRLASDTAFTPADVPGSMSTVHAPGYINRRLGGNVGEKDNDRSSPFSVYLNKLLQKEEYAGMQNYVKEKMIKLGYTPDQLDKILSIHGAHSMVRNLPSGQKLNSAYETYDSLGGLNLFTGNIATWGGKNQKTHAYALKSYIESLPFGTDRERFAAIFNNNFLQDRALKGNQMQDALDLLNGAKTNVEIAKPDFLQRRTYESAIAELEYRIDQKLDPMSIAQHVSAGNINKKAMRFEEEFNKLKPLSRLKRIFRETGGPIFANGGYIPKFAMGGILKFPTGGGVPFEGKLAERAGISINGSVWNWESYLKNGYGTAASRVAEGQTTRGMMGTQTETIDPRVDSIRRKIESELFGISPDSRARPTYGYLSGENANNTLSYGALQLHVDPEWLARNKVVTTTTMGDSLDSYIVQGIKSKVESLGPEHQPVSRFRPNTSGGDNPNSAFYREVQMHTGRIPPEAITGATIHLNTAPSSEIPAALTEETTKYTLHDETRRLLSALREASDLRTKFAEHGKELKVKLRTRAPSGDWGVEAGQSIDVTDYQQARALVLEEARALARRLNLPEEEINRYSADAKFAPALEALYPDSVIQTHRTNLGMEPYVNPNYKALGGPIKLADGGIPAMVSNGEYFFGPDTVKHYGKGFMDNLNAGKFATGGKIVGPGGPKDDLIPMTLPEHSYIINAAATQKIGTSTLDAINSKKFSKGGILGFATGREATVEEQQSLMQVKARLAKKALDAQRTAEEEHLTNKQERDAFESRRKAARAAIQSAEKELKNVRSNPNSTGTIIAESQRTVREARQAIKPMLQEGRQIHQAYNASQVRLQNATERFNVQSAGVPMHMIDPNAPRERGSLGQRISERYNPPPGVEKKAFRAGMGSMMAGTGLSMVGSMAGGALEANAGGATAASQAMQFAGTGAMLGSMLGPEGIAIGALGGAVIGGIMGKMAEDERNLTSEINKAHQKNMDFASSLSTSSDVLAQLGIKIKSISDIKLSDNVQQADAYANAINQVADAMANGSDATKSMINYIKTATSSNQVKALAQQFYGVLAAGGNIDQATVTAGGAAKAANLNGLMASNIINSLKSNAQQELGSGKSLQLYGAEKQFAGAKQMMEGKKVDLGKISNQTYSYDGEHPFDSMLPKDTKNYLDANKDNVSPAMGLNAARSYVNAFGTLYGKMLSNIPQLSNIPYLKTALNAPTQNTANLSKTLNYSGQTLPEGFVISSLRDMKGQTAKDINASGLSGTAALGSNDSKVAAVAKLAGVTKDMTDVGDVEAKINKYLEGLSNIDSALFKDAQNMQDAYDQINSGFTKPMEDAIMNMKSSDFKQYINAFTTGMGTTSDVMKVVADRVASDLSPEMQKLEGSLGNSTVALGNFLTAINAISGIHFESAQAQATAAAAITANPSLGAAAIKQTTFETQAASLGNKELNNINGSNKVSSLQAASKKSSEQFAANQKIAQKTYQKEQEQIQNSIKAKSKYIDSIRKEMDARQKLYDKKQQGIEQDLTLQNLQNDVYKARTTGSLLDQAAAQSAYNAELNKQADLKAKQKADEKDQSKIDKTDKQINNLQDVLDRISKNYDKTQQKAQDTQDAIQVSYAKQIEQAKKLGDTTSTQQAAWQNGWQQLVTAAEQGKGATSQEVIDLINGLTKSSGVAKTQIIKDFAEMQTKFNTTIGKDGLIFNANGTMTKLGIPNGTIYSDGDGKLQWKSSGGQPKFIDIGGTKVSVNSGPTVSKPPVIAGHDAGPKDPAPRKNAAAGGYISGPGTGTSDSIPARLSNGEYVVRANAVQHYGAGMMDAINTKKFAEGGIVGPDNVSGMKNGDGKLPKINLGYSVPFARGGRVSVGEGGAQPVVGGSSSTGPSENSGGGLSKPPWYPPVSANTVTNGRYYLKGGLHAEAWNKGAAGTGVNDIPASLGAYFSSLLDGIVSYVGKAPNDPLYLPGYVKVKNDRGGEIRYAHMKPMVSVGQKVKAGDSLGTAATQTTPVRGRTMLGPHLHFAWHDMDSLIQRDAGGRVPWLDRNGKSVFGSLSEKSGSPSENAGNGRDAVGSINYSQVQLVKLLQKAGFHDVGLRMAWAIAMRESGGRASARSPKKGTYPNGTYDAGLYQLNSSNYKGWKIDTKKLYDGMYQAKFVYDKTKNMSKDTLAWGLNPDGTTNAIYYRSGWSKEEISNYITKPFQKYWKMFPAVFNMAGGTTLPTSNPNNPNSSSSSSGTGSNGSGTGPNATSASSSIKSKPPLEEIVDYNFSVPETAGGTNSNANYNALIKRTKLKTSVPWYKKMANEASSYVGKVDYSGPAGSATTHRRKGKDANSSAIPGNPDTYNYSKSKYSGKKDSHGNKIYVNGMGGWNAPEFTWRMLSKYGKMKKFAGQDAQGSMGSPVKKGKERLGDLILKDEGNYNRVGIYVGEGKYVFADSPLSGTVKRSSKNYSKAVRFLADGGPVSGPGGAKDDKIPAMLSNGEFVVRADSVNSQTKPFLNMINAGTFNPKFNSPTSRVSTPSGLAESAGAGASTNNVEYNLTVTVEKTNASPEDIANVVIQTLKRKEKTNKTHRIL